MCCCDIPYDNPGHHLLGPGICGSSGEFVGNRWEQPSWTLSGTFAPATTGKPKQNLLRRTSTRPAAPPAGRRLKQGASDGKQKRCEVITEATPVTGGPPSQNGPSNEERGEFEFPGRFLSLP